jgi:hypothetical protein
MSKRTLQELYYDPSIGLGNLNAFYNKVKAYGYNRNEVQQFLQKQATYQINKEPSKRSFEYRHIKAAYTNEQWQIDLADMSQLKKYNGGYSWILIVVDVYSRFAYAMPLKSKTEKDVLDGLQKIIEQEAKTHPQSITTDQGKEFLNKTMTRMLNEYGIKQYTGNLNDKHKTAIAERFIRTLRNLIRKYQTANDTLDWIDVLPKLMTNYNNSLHSGIRAVPEEVLEGAGVNQQKPQVLTAPSIGDQVRVLEESDKFTKKSGAEKYSSEVYTVVRREGNSFVVENEGNELKTTYRPYQMYVVKEVEQPNVNERIVKRQEVVVENRIRRGLKKAGVDESNVVQGKRERKPKKIFDL